MKATDVRQALLDVAPGLIETADKLARGDLPDYSGDKQVLQAMLRLVSPVVDLKDDSVEMAEMRPELTLSDRVNAIQSAMFSGAISLAQAEAMVNTLSKSYDAIDSEEIKLALQKLASAT
jgi:hypothetical protein